MEILLTVLLFLPFIFLLWLANLAERERATRGPGEQSLLGVIAGSLLALFYAFLLLLGLVLFLIGVAARSSAVPGLDSMLAPAHLSVTSLAKIGLGLWLPALLGIVLLLPPVRRLLARLIPIDPRSAVHAVALSYSALVLTNLLVTLGYGLSNLAQAMEASTTTGAQPNLAGGVWAQDITMAVMALVGVGWLSRRSLGSALERLAVVVPTWRQVAIGLGTGLVMVPLIIMFEHLFSRVGVGPNPDVERLTEQMIGPLVASVPGILTLGLAAALGEETIFRGAMQPRFGLLLTATIFALLHSNYGITLSTLLVFLLGLVLGLLRLRYNTTTSMIAHAVYNMTLGVIAYLGLLQNF